MPDATSREIGEYRSSGIDAAAKALTAKLTANRSDSHRSRATPVNRHRSLPAHLDGDARRWTGGEELGPPVAPRRSLRGPDGVAHPPTKSSVLHRPAQVPRQWFQSPEGRKAPFFPTAHTRRTSAPIISSPSPRRRSSTASSLAGTLPSRTRCGWDWVKSTIVAERRRAGGT
jgi:hypothetical protein